MYLDSNVFVYACLSSDDIGERSRAQLRRVETGG
jgi:predicted nucleic acid-binding protein